MVAKSISVLFMCSFLPILSNNLITELAPQLKLYDSKETLQKVMDIIFHKQKGAYLRFGDGDLNIANGKGSKTHPTVTQEFQLEMQGHKGEYQ